MSVLHDSIKDDVLNELEQFEQSGDTTIAYYRDLGILDRNVMSAIQKVDTYLTQRFPNRYDILDYMSNLESHRSSDLIKDWDFNAMLANGSYDSPLDWLYGMLEDNLPYMIACGLLGYGRGLWELFDNFPCLHTLV
jgi:hypothetical protein